MLSFFLNDNIVGIPRGASVDIYLLEYNRIIVYNRNGC